MFGFERCILGAAAVALLIILISLPFSVGNDGGNYGFLNFLAGYVMLSVFVLAPFTLPRFLSRCRVSPGWHHEWKELTDHNRDPEGEWIKCAKCGKIDDARSFG